MDCTFADLPYDATGYFSAIVNGYVNNDEKLRPFFGYPASLEGIAFSIERRRRSVVDRPLLVDQLTEQYAQLDTTGRVAANIQLLASGNTFTVCTAHQPAIFTGNLFFIYKIVHAIKLAEELSREFPAFKFVPVFYMGSEDADLEELGHIFMDGEKMVWDTPQAGAIGRMHTKGLEKIIARIEGELLVHPFGKELITLLKECYLNSPDIQTATLKLVHHLFAAYGLLVFIPDNASLKKKMLPVFEDELLHQTSTAIVSKTVAAISQHFKAQAQPRNINLFYLTGDLRERIERRGEEWRVLNSNIVFTQETLLQELNEHPERFSPNVILRGIYQESILPDVAFIGGGGELAYWMELKALFDHYGVPYPVLVLRNSYLIIDRKNQHKMEKLGLSIEALFRTEQSILNEMVKKESGNQLSLQKEIGEVSGYYTGLRSIAEKVDGTLGAHVEALRSRSIKPLEVLEKKMLRAEKRKFEDRSRQVSSLKKILFPDNNLQERVENFMPFYARWGKSFIDMIFDHSFSLEQRFGVITVED